MQWSTATTYTDPDPGEVLTFSLTTAPTGMSIDGAGLVTYTPSTADIGTHNVTVRVQDAAGLFDTQDYMLTVQASVPPVAAFRLNKDFDAAFIPSGGAVASVSDEVVGGEAVNALGGVGAWKSDPATAQSLVVDLVGDDLHLVDRITIESPAGNTSVKDFEIRVSKDSPTSGFESVFTGTHVTSGAAVEYTFDVAEARYVELIVNNNHGSFQTWVEAFKVFPRVRQGGLVSNPDGGATLVSPAAAAAMLSEFGGSSSWFVSGGSGSIIIELAGGQTPIIDRVRFAQSVEPAFSFDIRVSTTTTDPGAFTSVAQGTSDLSQGDQWALFDPAPAKYLELALTFASSTRLYGFEVYANNCGGTALSADNLSSDLYHDITSYLWDFGDGAVDRTKHPKHEYLASGIYPVSLTVTNTEGLTHTATMDYEASAPSPVDFTWTPNPIVEGGIAIFTPVGTFSEYRWTPSRSVPSLVGNDMHLPLSDNGPLTVTLEVTNANGVVSSVTKDVPVLNAGPVVTAGANLSGVWGETLLFDLAAFTDLGPDDTHECAWDYGDGVVEDYAACLDGAQATARHIYAAPGVYAATLFVRDSDAEVGSASLTVTINPHPTRLVVTGSGSAAANGDIDVTARLEDAYALTPVLGETIVFSLSAQTDNGLTDSNGDASGSLTFAENVSNTVGVSFAGSALYLASAAAGTFAPTAFPGTPTLDGPPTDNRGQEFMVAFMNNNDVTATDPELVIVTDGPRTVTIDAPSATFFQTLNIATATVVRVSVPGALTIVPSGLVENKGIEIIATDDIQVFGHQRQVLSSETFLAWPKDALQTDYVAVGYETGVNGVQLMSTLFGVVAVEDGTVVTITSPVGAITQSVNNAFRAWDRDVPFTVELDKFEVFQAMPTPGYPTPTIDISGTRFVSNKPIVVYGGNQCANVRWNEPSCNHVIEQMPPAAGQVQTYLVPPVAGRVVPSEVVLAPTSPSGALVTVNGGATFFVAYGLKRIFEFDNEDYAVIEATGPIEVAQFAAGFSNNVPADSRGDPGMRQILPTSEFSSDFTLYAHELDGTDPTFSYIDVTANVADLAGLRLNGAPITSQWRPFGDSGFAGTQVQVASNAAHTLHHVDPNVTFSAAAYGWADFDAYFHNGGWGSIPVSPACTFSAGTSGDTIDNDCDGATDEELANQIDDDFDGIIDEDLASGETRTNLVPTAVTQTVEVVINTNTPFVLAGHDDNADPITFDIFTEPSNGTLAVYDLTQSPPPALPSNTNVGPVLFYVPNANYTGTDSLVFVAKDAEGSSVNTTINFNVNDVGSPPQVLDAPLEVAIENVQYDWAFTVTDPDVGDTFNVVLDVGPPGMGVGGGGSNLVWTPGDTDVGVHPVTFRVIDSTDRFTTVSYNLTVQNVPDAPIISSTPEFDWLEGDLMTYQVIATDADINPVLTYTLVTPPTGMTINSATGLIEWQTDGDDVGLHPTGVTVTDDTSIQVTQTFTLQVLPFINTDPILIPVGTATATEGDLMSLFLSASDPDEFQDPPQTLTYFKIFGPTGLSVDNQTGRVTWIPTEQQVGTFTAQVAVQDSEGGFDSDIFTITVTGINDPPAITSTPNLAATMGRQYSYAVHATDPDNDALAFTIAAPATAGGLGMQIDQNTGRLEWTPTVYGTGTQDITVRATDPDGLFGEQTFTVVLTPDTTDPSVFITLSSASIDPGQSVTVTVNAFDDVAVTARTLTLDGNAVTLDGNFQAVLSPTTPGIYVLQATATDAAGNTGTDDASFGVTDPTDTTAPTVTLLGLSDDQVVTAPVTVSGTADDANLTRYTLDAAKGETGDFVTLVASNTPVVGGTLGTFDPTLMENGLYEVKLEATDLNGAVTSTSVSVRVEGGMKIGVFTLSFVDLAIPVSGIPITVTRTYDSRIKTNEDFGVGWTLDVAAGRYEHNRAPGIGWDITKPFNEPFAPACSQTNELVGHTTEVRLSDREYYRFTPTIQAAAPFLGGCIAQIVYVQSGGLTPGASLQILGNDIVTHVTNSGELRDDFTFEIFNPKDVRLTTYDGRMVDFNRDNGITRLEDLNGNELFIDATGIQHSNGKSIVFDRDAAGRITKITDPMGFELKYVYDAAGDLVSVTDQENNETLFTYDPDHLLVDIIDPLGNRAVRSEYDVSGRLVASIDALGNRIEMTHDLVSRVETTQDRLGFTETHEYDLRGNVTRKVDKLGGQTLYTYDLQDNEIEIVDAVGRTSTRTYNLNNQLMGVMDFEGHTTTLERDIRGNVTRTEDARGRVTTAVYSLESNLLSSTDGEGATTTYGYDVNSGELLTVTDALNQVTTLTYDADGNEITRTDPLGNVTTTAYDANGRRTSSARTRTLPDSSTQTLTTLFEWDASGRPTTTQDADGYSSEIQYNARGKTERVIGKNGTIVEYGPDPTGLLSEISHIDGTSDRYVYDAEGRTVQEVDRLGNVTSHEYDALGRKTRTTHSDGATHQWTYDATGRVLTETNELGGVTTFAYGPSTRSITDPNNNTVLEEYNSDEQIERLTDARGNITLFTYDRASRRHGEGRLVRTDFDDGTFATVGFDLLGRRVAITDQLGRTTQFTYDASSRLTSVTDADSKTWTYTYDEVDNRTSMTDPNTNATLFEFDEMGRMTRRELPVGQFETYSYDEMGNVVSKTDFNGDTTTWTYDAQNRMTTRTLPGESAVGFSHDVLGRRVGATTGRVWVYDSRNRVVEDRKPTGESLFYTYDSAGNRTGLTGPHGSASYGFDAAGRVTSITGPTGAFTYGYDEMSNVTSLTFPNGVITTREYDDLNRIAGIETRGPQNQLIAEYDYTRDATGRVTIVDETHAGRTVTYGYDPTYRLISEDIIDPTNGNRTITYQYDDVGNRLSRDDTVRGLTTYVYDGNDRLLSYTSSVGTTAQSYDGNGNVIQRGGLSFTYDGRNLQTSVYDGTDQYVYEYDVEGAGILQNLNGAVRERFLVDHNMPNHQIVRVTDAGDTQQARHVFGVEYLLVSDVQGEGVRYRHSDAQHSTRRLTDTVGDVAEQLTFDGFGVRVSSSGGSSSVYGYAGERRESESEQIYLRARRYHPEVGRFSGMDAELGAGFAPATMHRYSYVSNDPSTLRDPSGRFFVPVLQIPTPGYRFFPQPKFKFASIGKAMLLQAAALTAEGVLSRIAGLDHASFREIYFSKFNRQRFVSKRDRPKLKGFQLPKATTEANVDAISFIYKTAFKRSYNDELTYLDDHPMCGKVSVDQVTGRRVTVAGVQEHNRIAICQTAFRGSNSASLAEVVLHEIFHSSADSIIDFAYQTFGTQKLTFINPNQALFNADSYVAGAKTVVPGF